MTGPHRGNSGFTLLEMLAALALAGVLAGGVYASLHIGFRARASAETSIAPARAAMLALELLRRDVTTALPPTGILAGPFIGEQGAASAEGADRLELHALVTDPVSGIPGIRKVEFDLVPAENGAGFLLVRRVTANLLAPVVPEPEEEVLCRHVVSFGLHYFDGFSWLDSWHSTVQGDSAPAAVEVTLGVHPPGAEEYVLTRRFLVPASAPGGRELMALEEETGT